MAVVFTGSGKLTTDTWVNPVPLFCGTGGPGFTISYWIMMTGGSSFPGACTSTQGSSPASNCFYHTIDVAAGNQLLVGCYDTGAADHFDSTGILLTSNVWIHITSYYEGNLGSGGHQTFVNGRMARDGSLNCSISNRTTNVTNSLDIGCGDSPTNLVGKMAQVRMFQGRLSGTDVRMNMRSAMCPIELRGQCMLDAPLSPYNGGNTTSVQMLGPAGLRFNSVTPTAPLTHLEVFGGTLGGFAPDPNTNNTPALRVTEQPWLVAGTGAAAGPSYVAPEIIVPNYAVQRASNW